MSDWQPTPLETMSAMMFVLSEESVYSDALYIFGSLGDKDLDSRELNAAADLYDRGLARRVGVNCPTIAEVSERFDLTGYGFEFLKRELLSRGVHENDIFANSPTSFNTAGEARNLLRMVAEEQWRVVTIMAYPFHQLRCFLQLIALLDSPPQLKIYNKSFTLRDIDWQRPIKRPILKGSNLLGMTDMNEPMASHTAADYERVVKYAQDPALSGEHHTRHATIPEMFRYVAKRHSL